MNDDVLRDPEIARCIKERQGFRKHVEHTEAKAHQKQVEYTDADRAKWREAARLRRERETPEQRERRLAHMRDYYRRRYLGDPEFSRKEIRRVDAWKANKRAAIAQVPEQHRHTHTWACEHTLTVLGLTDPSQISDIDNACRIADELNEKEKQ